MSRPGSVKAADVSAGDVTRMRRSPLHPGEIFRKEFREPASVTQVDAARRLGIPLARLNAIELGKRAVSPETALLFAAMTATRPEFWMQLQARYDLWHTRQRIGPVKVKTIGRRAAASRSDASVSTHSHFRQS